MELNLNELYDKLEIAYNEKNYQDMLDIVTIVTGYPLMKKDFVFQCLYLLIKNNYHIEVSQMLEKINFFKKDQIKLNILEKAIKNQEQYYSLTEEQRDVYHTAIMHGRFCYQEGDLYTAYDIYSWAYYVTEQPIFLYYIGKMLYKNKKFKDAESYFKEYVKVGDSKVAKAYLYLSVLEKKRHKYNAAKCYADYIIDADKVYGDNFELEEIYSKDDDIDILKIKLQNKNLREKRTTY